MRLEEIPGVSVPYVHFHPTLAPFLARDLPVEDRAGAGDALLAGLLPVRQLPLPKRQQRRLTRPAPWPRRELPNLTAALRLALAAGALDEAVEFADRINLFLNVFGRWRERDEVMGMVEREMGREKGGKGRKRGKDHEARSSCWRRSGGSGSCRWGGRGRRRGCFGRCWAGWRRARPTTTRRPATTARGRCNSWAGVWRRRASPRWRRRSTGPRWPRPPPWRRRSRCGGQRAYSHRSGRCAGGSGPVWCGEAGVRRITGYQRRTLETIAAWR